MSDVVEKIKPTFTSRFHKPSAFSAYAVLGAISLQIQHNGIPTVLGCWIGLAVSVISAIIAVCMDDKRKIEVT